MEYIVYIFNIILVYVLNIWSIWKVNWILYYEYDEWLDSFLIILKFCLGVISNKGFLNVCFIN